MSYAETNNENGLDPQLLLEEYLSNALPTEWPRVDCCGSSRSLYCPFCYRILIPREHWPNDILEAKSADVFPFHLDIFLGKKERKTCATGVQVAAIANALESPEGNKDKAFTSVETEAYSLDSTTTGPVNFYSFEDHDIPNYNHQDFPNTYVLFPEEGSVPIASVGKIDRLVVLDIKWSKQSGNSRFRSLPRVHLDSPPDQSHFWRWHSEGVGMLSTIEAIYFAAMEVTADWHTSDRRKLINIMWLFAAQYAIVKKKSAEEERILPFSEQGKLERRRLRQLHPKHPSHDARKAEMNE